jgi:putative Holliday junction resolvase
MRVLGLDLGEARIGVAVSDASGTIASPHGVVQRSGDRVRDHEAIAALVAELGAERVVVGLPLSMSGAEGPAAKGAREEAAALAERLDVAVETHDERLTTVAADRAMIAQGMKGKARRKVVDQVAAAVMLQSWLERVPR